MKNLREFIIESAAQPIQPSTPGDVRDWFMKLPVFVLPFTTSVKYNIRNVRKDPNKFRIIIGNEYNKFSQNRDLVIDLKPYIKELSKYPVENCMLRIDAGEPLDPKHVVIHNTDVYDENEDKIKKGDAFSRGAVLNIWCYDGPLMWSKDAHLKDGLMRRYPVIYNDKCEELLRAVRFLDDYPRDRNLGDDENATYWTELINNL